MRQSGVYSNPWGQKVQIPFGDMDCGKVTFKLPEYTIRIDFYGDGQRVEEWDLKPIHFAYAVEDITKFMIRKDSE